MTQNCNDITDEQECNAIARCEWRLGGTTSTFDGCIDRVASDHVAMIAGIIFGVLVFIFAVFVICRIIQRRKQQQDHTNYDVYMNANYGNSNNAANNLSVASRRTTTTNNNNDGYSNSTSFQLYSTPVVNVNEENEPSSVNESSSGDEKATALL